MENKRRKKTVGLFLRPMQRLMDEATETVDRLIGGVARVSSDQNSPITYWRTDYDLTWEELAAYSGVKSFTSTISSSPKAEIECPSCHEEPPLSPKPLSSSSSKHSHVTVDYLDHFVLPDQTINVGDVNSLIDLFGNDLNEMTEETLAIRLIGYALCYTGERPELFELLLRALCNSEKKEVRKLAFFQISELASFASFNGRSFHTLIDLFCSYLRRIEQFNSFHFIEYASHWTSCDDEEQPPTLNDLISIEDILDQSLRLMYETATEPKMRRRIAVNFCKILTHCSCLFVYPNFDSNNPIKNLYFDILWSCIPILRQLFPRALSHVNLAYAQWLHIDLADRMVCRLAELMVFDPDSEVRSLALNAFRRGCEMYTGDKDDFEMRQMVELAVLHDFRLINKTMSTATSTCQFFIKKNKRNCQNAPKEGHQFCYRHLSTEVEGSSREVSESPAPSLKNQPVASPIEEEGESVHVSPQKLFGTSTASQPIEQSPSSPEVAVQSDPKLTPRSSPVKSKQSDSSPSKRSTTSKLSVSTAIEAPEILNKKNATRREKLDGYSLWLSRCIKANDWEGINNVFENIHSNPRSLSSNLVSGLAFQLSRDDVLPFLKIAANVLSSAPVIAGLWFKFVDDVIRKHMKELSMHLDSEIGELLSYIECRTKNLEQIMRLQGKLQFLFEQTTKRNEGKEAIHDDSAIVFEDGDSDDENIKEVEEIANNSTSDLFSDEDDEKRKKLRSRRSTNHSTSAMEVD
ncbi:hypothetical protein M3Y94_00732700 [Aphelenchoides besseyi]|nr:hypothetical protein M3Y94_00732700 [Aphelenchoides besseyi]